MKYWLMKSEPGSFSIDDLEKSPGQVTFWEGVRNYQARNFLREMMSGDKAFFYHSSCANPGITGIIEIITNASPDITAFNPDSAYYDIKSTAQNPRWFGVKVKLIKKFFRIISLKELRLKPVLSDMVLLRRGSRLSITPVTGIEWQCILADENN